MSHNSLLENDGFYRAGLSGLGGLGNISLKKKTDDSSIWKEKSYPDHPDHLDREGFELWQICDTAPHRWQDLGDCFDRRSTGIRRRRWWQAEAQRVAGRPVTLECSDDGAVWCVPGRPVDMVPPGLLRARVIRVAVSPDFLDTSEPRNEPK